MRAVLGQFSILSYLWGQRNFNQSANFRPVYVYMETGNIDQYSARPMAKSFLYHVTTERASDGGLLEIPGGLIR